MGSQLMSRNLMECFIETNQEQQSVARLVASRHMVPVSTLVHSPGEVHTYP